MIRLEFAAYDKIPTETNLKSLMEWYSDKRFFTINDKRKSFQ
jgi:hypothetical protein